MFRQMLTSTIDFFWAHDGQDPEDRPSIFLINPSNLMPLLTNPGQTIKNFVDKIESEVDDPDKGGMNCAILSNCYFIKVHHSSDPEQKDMYNQKSQFYLNKVYEKNDCKGLLMLAMLYGVGTMNLTQHFTETLGYNLETVLNTMPELAKSTDILSLIGFGESNEVKQQKAVELAFKALEIDQVKTLEFCNSIPSFSNTIVIQLVKEFILQKETIKNLQSKIANLELQIELEPSLMCHKCGSEVGGGQLFKAAKLDFTTHSQK